MLQASNASAKKACPRRRRHATGVEGVGNFPCSACSQLLLRAVQLLQMLLAEKYGWLGLSRLETREKNERIVAASIAC